MFLSLQETSNPLLLLGFCVLEKSLAEFIFTTPLQWQAACDISVLFELCTWVDFIVCHYFLVTWN